MTRYTTAEKTIKAIQLSDVNISATKNPPPVCSSGQKISQLANQSNIVTCIVARTIKNILRFPEFLTLEMITQ